MAQMIKVDSVSKYFDTVRAVDDVSFTVGTGQVVGLLGPNGAGKTTTMRLLTGYLAADDGTIDIDGHDPATDPVAARSVMGYLPENNPLYEEMFVDEYLRFIGALRGIAGGELSQAIDRAAREVGVTEVLARPIGELSKGYRQRTGLAAAVLHEPKVVILDEPTEGLDPNQRVDIRTLIRKIGKKRTVLVSTHVLSEVQNTCDRVLVMADGRLVADSPMADLAKQAMGTRAFRVLAKGTGIQKALESLSGIALVRRDPDEKRIQSYTVTAKGDVDLRPLVFRLAADSGWELYELHEQKATLEEVFRQLTSDYVADDEAHESEKRAKDREGRPPAPPRGEREID
jgi:ABC-2 type transport system ATP-binding protein